MRSASRLLPLAGALLLALPLAAAPVGAADFGLAPMVEQAPASLSLRAALSRYLSLEMIRVTFDVVARDELEARLEEQALRWGNIAPSATALADLDRQLLSEASYYLVSLSYLVQVGGAVFPDDRAEAVYTNDTLAKLDGLRRELMDAIETGAEVLPVLLEVEKIHALTEGFGTVPQDLTVFSEHDAVLERVMSRLARGTPT